MPVKQIVINSKSSGAYELKTINKRQHLVTSMMSIEGDSVMNQLFYPHAEVRDAHTQLDRLPAPVEHPVIDGAFVSALDPIATNAHNVGAFVSNPRIKGKQVINDLAIDLDVAEKDERGKEIINRIKSGERIGVSTGLNADLINVSSEHKGKPYKGIINNIKFDHVAILLDEKPAGENTYTLNSEGEGIIICEAETYSELREKVQKAADVKYNGDDSYAYVEELLIDPPRAVIDVNDNGKKRMIAIPYDINEADEAVFVSEGEIVERKTIYKPVGSPAEQTTTQEGKIMDIKKLLMSLVSDARNSLTADDVEKLEGMTEKQVTNALHEAMPEPEAPEGLAEYLANKAGYDAYIAEKQEARKALIDEIVTNSDATAAQLENVDDSVLKLLAMKKKPDFSAQAGITTNANDAGIVEVDYS